IAHDLLDVAADITDFGELRGFDLQEGRLRKPGEPARDLRLAHAGGADHQNVLRQHLFAQGFRQLLAAPPIAQRNRYRSFGFVLTDDIAIELGNDLAGSEEGRHQTLRLSRVTFSLVKTQMPAAIAIALRATSSAERSS